MFQSPLWPGVSAGREPAPPDRPGLLAMFGLSAWCGLVSGLLEVAAILARKHFLDSNQLLGLSRHFAWLVPITDILLLMLVGVLGVVASRIRPASGRWALPRILAALTILPALLVLFPRIYRLAWLFLSLGASIRLVPILERHGRAFRRVAWIVGPIGLAILAAAAARPWIVDWDRLRLERSRPIPAGAPNIVLMVMDTVAAGHLDLYGYPRSTSPAIDELAGRGCRFDAAVSACSWTLPSHASFFTGRWPHELSAGWRTPLDGTWPTVAEALSGRGYATAGFIANTLYCSRDSGLDRGFTVYRDYLFRELSPFRMAVLIQWMLDGLQATGDLGDDLLGFPLLASAAREVRDRFETDRKDAAEVARELLDWLDHRPDPDRPFFAFLNFDDAHSPYHLPPHRVHRFGPGPTDDQEARLIRDWWPMDKSGVTPREVALVADSYDNCVASLDEQIGRLVDELGRRGVLDRTWILLVADHGESFGEHPGVYLHGSSLYRTEIHVPMVVVPPPGTPIRPVVARTVSLRDLAPTIAGLAGVPDTSRFPGESLSKWWAPGPGEPPAGVGALAEVVPNEMLIASEAPDDPRLHPIGGLTEDGWSYIRREAERREELYDLERDPGENRNLAPLPGARSRLKRMRSTFSRIAGGPITPDRFRP